VTVPPIEPKSQSCGNHVPSLIRTICESLGNPRSLWWNRSCSAAGNVHGCHLHMRRTLDTRRTLAALIVIGMGLGGAGYVWHYWQLLSDISRQHAAVAELRGGAMPQFEVIDADGQLAPVSAVLAASGAQLHAVALVRPGCPRCEVVSGRLRALQRRHGGALAIVSVDVRAPEAGELPGVRDAGVVRDARGAFPRIFHGVVTPIVLFVGRDGRVEAAWSGLPDAQALEAACERLLAVKAS